MAIFNMRGLVNEFSQKPDNLEESLNAMWWQELVFLLAFGWYVRVNLVEQILFFFDRLFLLFLLLWSLLEAWQVQNYPDELTELVDLKCAEVLQYSFKGFFEIEDGNSFRWQLALNVVQLDLRLPYVILL